MVVFGVAPILTPVEGTFANSVYYKNGDITGHVTVTVVDCVPIKEIKYDFSAGGR